MVSRYHSYLQTAARIIEQYKGEVPLAVFLKRFFSENKRYGSRDRKQISALCYNYFRLGHAAKNLPVADRLLLGAFLAGQKPLEMIAAIRPEWAAATDQSLQNKIALLNNVFSLAEVFPYKTALSSEIEVDRFCASFLVQPDLFVRIRPGKKMKVLDKLRQSGLVFSVYEEDALALPNATHVAALWMLNEEVVVQDLNSQRVLDFYKVQSLEGKNVWDCCAASGGKSILLYDLAKGKIHLTVSDKRASIMVNLRARFAEAGIRRYQSFTADLVNGAIDRFPFAPSFFDAIICDVPCTGSGTWGRTPEQLAFFNIKELEHYSRTQKEIVTTVLPFLKKGGTFTYITCSVFKEENEHLSMFIQQTCGLTLLQSSVLRGYDQKADTMFVAVFVK